LGRGRLRVIKVVSSGNQKMRSLRANALDKLVGLREGVEVVGLKVSDTKPKRSS
jgi:hypothetical protein